MKLTALQTFVMYYIIAWTGTWLHEYFRGEVTDHVEVMLIAFILTWCSRQDIKG